MAGKDVCNVNRYKDTLARIPLVVRIEKVVRKFIINLYIKYKKG